MARIESTLDAREAGWPASEPQSSSPNLEGQLFSNRYRVIQRIGAGGIGEVFTVEQVHVKRIFALKTLRQDYRSDALAMERFAREARVGGRLRSEHTVAIVDSGVHEGIPYLVMEYLEGQTLADLLEREGMLPLPRALRLFLGACRGVSAAHALGVIHRDLKPSNLFVCPGVDTETCKVLDFGIAKLANPSTHSDAFATRSGALIGTLAYMPPEQIRGERELDVRADVYSLGAILYECLGGARLFQADSPHSLMYKILEQVPVRVDRLRQGLPAGLVDVIHRALAQDKAKRFASVAEFVAAIAPYAQPHAGGVAVPLDNATLDEHAQLRLPNAVEAESVAIESGRRRWRAGWLLAAVLGAAAGIAFVRLNPESIGLATEAEAIASSALAVSTGLPSMPDPGTQDPGTRPSSQAGVLPDAEGSVIQAAPAPSTHGDEPKAELPQGRNKPPRRMTARPEPSPEVPPEPIQNGERPPSLSERVGF